MTNFSPVIPALLDNTLSGLKRRNVGQTAFTNYFLQPLNGVSNLRMLESEKSLCFLHDEWDFGRAYFCTFDDADLERMLHAVEWPPIVVADWITRGPPSTVGPLLTAVGFHLHATYDRIVSLSLRIERPNAHFCLAGQADRDAIHMLLLQAFDKYADHIISLDDLAELIGQNQVLLGRGPQGDINGFVIFRVKASKCNFYFLYNGGSSLDLAHLLGNFYGALANRGIRSGFSWVRRTRSSVLRLHQAFGWKKDGLVDYIYLR